MPAEAHRRFRADERARRERNTQERARRLALHEAKKQFIAEWMATKGTPEQQARQAAGMLPMAEAIEGIGDDAFAAFREWPPSVRDGAATLQARLRQYPQYHRRGGDAVGPGGHRRGRCGSHRGSMGARTRGSRHPCGRDGDPSDAPTDVAASPGGADASRCTDCWWSGTSAHSCCVGNLRVPAVGRYGPAPRSGGRASPDAPGERPSDAHEDRRPTGRTPAPRSRPTSRGAMEARGVPDRLAARIAFQLVLKRAPSQLGDARVWSAIGSLVRQDVERLATGTSTDRPVDPCRPAKAVGR